MQGKDTRRGNDTMRRKETKQGFLHYIEPPKMEEILDFLNNSRMFTVALREQPQILGWNTTTSTKCSGMRHTALPSSKHLRE